MVAPAKRSAPPTTVPVTLDNVVRLALKQLEREIKGSSQVRVAAALKWPRSSLQYRLEHPETMTREELDQLCQRYKVRLFASLI